MGISYAQESFSRAEGETRPMLRITILAVFILFVKTEVFSQDLNVLDFIEPEHISNGSTYDRINYSTPGWADTFADSTIKKVLIPSKKTTSECASH